MMTLFKLPALIGPTLIAVFLTTLVHAHPIWNIFNTRNSIDSLVTGSSVLLAGGVKFGVPYYLTTPSPPGTSALWDGRAMNPVLHEASRLDRKPHCIFSIQPG